MHCLAVNPFKMFNLVPEGFMNTNPIDHRRACFLSCLLLP